MRKSKDEKQYCIGIATLIDGRLSNIKYYEDYKSSVIENLNNDISHRLIDSFLKAKIVINLAFDKEEFLNLKEENKEAYYTNLEYWYTLDELQNMGAIELK